MKKLMLALLICLGSLVFVHGNAFAAGPSGYWPFDGNLVDVAGKGHYAQGKAAFVPGRKGMALKVGPEGVSIPSNPELQLAPGLLIDCWVCLDKLAEGHQIVVTKDKEYLLRLDSTAESGRFRFFVYLNGWEPRVGVVIPEIGRWHHLVAQWTGSEVRLTVDGKTDTASRPGTPIPTDNPVVVGDPGLRIDELTIDSPFSRRGAQLAALAARVADARRTAQTTFGAKAGWAGWQADGGAQANAAGGALRLHSPGAEGMLFHPGLNVDLTGRKIVTLDLESTTTDTACLVFLTDRGSGAIPFPLWDGGRAAVVDLSDLPQWAGHLRFLGVSFPEAGMQHALLRGVWISDQSQGGPFLYARSLAPGRAVMRAGREEQILAVVRNMGSTAHGVRVTLTPPAGVRLLEDAEKKLPDLGNKEIGQLSWRVQADAPVTGKAQLTMAAEGVQPTTTSQEMRFQAPVNLPRASYVPEPQPVTPQYLTLMHYCPLWKAGTHYGWGKIEPWPERRPAIGFYDEGTPEVADWQIKYAVEHGVQGFIYCWYRNDFSPKITHSLGHAIHDGMLKAKYLDKFKFCIMWENGCAKGVQSREDMLNNLLPYWIENYFKNPSYVKIDNKPVLFVWRPERVSPELGGSEAARAVFDEMRAQCRRNGFDGLILIGCVGDADQTLLQRMAREGWDASSAYGISGPTTVKPGRDMDGASTTPAAAWIEGEKKTWLGKKEIGALPDIVDVMMGWDPRPWHGEKTTAYQTGTTPEIFKQACLNARQVIEATPGNGLDKRVVVFDNWNEFGEGHYLEPCSGYGFGFLDAIRDVFCPNAGPHVDIVPEDAGLEPPEHIYRRQQKLIGNSTRERQVVDNLVAWWRFEDDDPAFGLDSSQCGFTGVKNGFVSGPGYRGKGFHCSGSSMIVGEHPLFMPQEGITVELWVRPSAPNQADRWMLNTVGAADSGYRLGLGDGKVAWQIPQTTWSHSLNSPEPLPVGKWSHVAATYDNQMMRIYVNGAECASLQRGGPIRPAHNGLTLGNFAAGNPSAFFQGDMDEVRIYNRALTAAEIRAHYEEK